MSSYRAIWDGKPTTVVKVNGRQRDKFLADPEFVYVGRKFAGFEASIFGNPFTKSMADDPALEFAKKLLIAMKPEGFQVFPGFAEIARNLPALAGKRLGCWCLDWDGESSIPYSCHAVILALASEGHIALLNRYVCETEEARRCS